MKTDLVKSMTLDYMATKKMMVAKGNNFRQKESEEFETAQLHTPYRLVALMLNRIFGRADGRFYNIGWIPLVYHVTMMRTVFNLANIVANSLSYCITIAKEGSH